MDSQIKLEIIKYFKGEIERMCNVMRIKELVFGIESELRELDEKVVRYV